MILINIRRKSDVGALRDPVALGITLKSLYQAISEAVLDAKLGTLNRQNAVQKINCQVHK